MIPMIADGFLQLLTSYESNNLKRFITGFLFGFGLAMLFVIATIKAYNYGSEIGKEIVRKRNMK